VSKLALASVRVLDVRQFGMARRGAAYLIGSGPYALVEAGTPNAADVLIEAADGIDLAFIFVSHIHLDHAGAAGALARAHPEATVVVHPRAARHLADPSRLVEGVRAASPDLFEQYGTPLPIHPSQLHEVGDGESFTVGELTIEAIHTPGHAPHHVCYFASHIGLLFTGDAAGNHALPVDVPLTVPPRFDIETSIVTLQRLRSLKPQALAYTHFGIAADDPDGRLRAYEEAIRAWFERLLNFRNEEEAAQAIVSEPRFRNLDPRDKHSIEMCIRGGFRTLEIMRDDAG